MKLCSYHMDDLRTQLLQHGVPPSGEPFFTAQSLVIAKVLAEEPSVTGHPGCPICYCLTPSWLTDIAIHLARRSRTH